MVICYIAHKIMACSVTLDAQDHKWTNDRMILCGQDNVVDRQQ